MSSTTYDISVILRVLDKATGPLRSIGSRFQNLVPSVAAADAKLKQIGQSLQNVGARMGHIGKRMTFAVSLPLLAAGALALKASMDFNEAMANVATLIPGNINRVNELKKAVQDMAIRTATGTDIMAEGLYQVISAFEDSADTTKILEINAKAAKAGVATVLDAVNLTSAVTKAYGDTSAEAAEKAADLAFQTVRLGQTTFPELAGAIPRVTSLAAQLGISMEEVFGTFATLTGVTGPSTNEISTQFAGLLNALLKPTDMMQKALDHLHQIGRISQPTGKALLAKDGFIGAFRVLKDLAKGEETLLGDMFGERQALIALFALIGSLSEDYTRKTKAMHQSTGAMTEAFKEQSQGINRLGFQWQQFKVRIDVLRQTLGDALAPAFNRVLDFLEPLITKFTNLSPAMQKAILIFGAVVGALGALSWAIAPIITAIGTLSLALAGTAFGTFLVGLGTLTAPILAITAAIAGVGLAIYQVHKHWDRLKEDAKAIVDWTKDLGQATVGGIKDFISTSFTAPTPALASESRTSVDIHVTSDPGLQTNINGVKTDGKSKVKVASEGYVGVHDLLSP